MLWQTDLFGDPYIGLAFYLLVTPVLSSALVDVNKIQGVLCNSAGDFRALYLLGCRKVCTGLRLLRHCQVNKISKNFVFIYRKWLLLFTASLSWKFALKPSFLKDGASNWRRKAPPQTS